MARPLAQRLGVRPGGRVLVLDAPEHYVDLLDPAPDVRIETRPEPGAEYDVVQIFVRDRAAVVAAVPVVLGLRLRGPVWMCYPKRSGSIPSDLHRDSGWSAMADAGWSGVAQVAVDPDWTATRFRPESEIVRGRDRRDRRDRRK